MACTCGSFPAAPAIVPENMSGSIPDFIPGPPMVGSVSDDGAPGGDDDPDEAAEDGEDGRHGEDEAGGVADPLAERPGELHGCQPSLRPYQPLCPPKDNNTTIVL